MCWKGILHVLGLCGAESGKDVLQKLVGGFMLTFHLIHGGLNGTDTVHMDQLVLKGLSDGAFSEAEESVRNPK